MTRQSSLHDVHAAMHVVTEHRDLSVVLLTTYWGRLAVVEGVAHELAHQLEAGRNFELRIRVLDDAAANNHEASALRIEVAGLALLGIRVSLQTLWRAANWRDTRPPLTRKSCTPSAREQRCAAAFARIVQDVIRKSS